LAAALAGCGPRPAVEPAPSIALEKIPPEIMAKAKERLPGVEFERAWVETEDGTTAYEIRGRDDDGKTRELKINAQGEVLEVE
jgi:uncharacterized membrane protein YkoI